MIYVKDCTYNDLTSLQDNATLGKVLQTMKRHRLNAVPIVNHVGDYLGCISEQDVLNATMPNYMKLLKDPSFMSEINGVLKHLIHIIDKPALLFIDKNYPTVKGTDSASHAAQMMQRSQRIVLPVLEKGKLVGMITRIDVLFSGFVAISKK